jgi:antitoxin VapB
MKRRSRARSMTSDCSAVPKAMAEPSFRRASLFRNGANQAVRLPQELRFPDSVREVRIRKLADGLLLSPVRPDWSSFFALGPTVHDDFLLERRDLPPQTREPL